MYRRNSSLSLPPSLHFSVSLISVQHYYFTIWSIQLEGANIDFGSRFHRALSMAAFVHALEQSSKAVPVCTHVYVQPSSLSSWPYHSLPTQYHQREPKHLDVSPSGTVQTQTVTECSVPRSLTLKYLFSDCLLRCSDTSSIFSLWDEFLVCYTTNFLDFSCIRPSLGLIDHFSKEPLFIFLRKAS